jgi:hypothetical protein
MEYYFLDNEKSSVKVNSFIFRKFAPISSG